MYRIRKFEIMEKLMFQIKQIPKQVTQARDSMNMTHN